MAANEQHQSSGMVYGLIAHGVVARLMPHPPNVTPLTALALFGAARLSKRWAIVLPLATVVISDLFLGLHDVILFTWSGFAITGLLGLWLRNHPSLTRVGWVALAGSTIFFLITNFGVWLLGDGGLMYPKTLEGLWQCYVAALPFYRNALAGDLVFTLGMFGLYAWLTRDQALTSPAQSR